jgi:hypothetical protein
MWLAWCVMALLHVMYARWGWYDRYQAYIVVSGTLLLLRTLPELRFRRPMHIGAALLAVLVLLPFTRLEKDFQAPDYAHQISREQGTLGRLLAADYDGKAVMVNDIGQVSWQHRGGLDDLWALGSYDILRAYRSGEMGKPFVARIAARDNVQVAAVYGVLHTYIPDEWVEVARWSTAGTGRPENSDVVFYARDAAGAAVLRTNLAQFASSLPPDVVQVLH